MSLCLCVQLITLEKVLSFGKTQIYLVFHSLIRIFAPKSKKITNMTTIELNAELYRAMGEIADNKLLLEKVLVFVKSLKATKETTGERKSSIESVAGSRTDMDDKMLDAALAKFHKDWGGEGSAMEIAEELRSARGLAHGVVPLCQKRNI